MKRFTTPLVVELIGKNKWKVYEDFAFGDVRVPVGFITDFASVPRLFWAFISPVDRHGKAAVIHDYCYRYALYKRRKCDIIMLEGMETLNVPKWKRLIIYFFIRTCGWWPWLKYRWKELG